MKPCRSDSVKRDMTSKSSSCARSKSRFCHCGDEVLLLTSNTASNPGQVFWRCQNWGEGTNRTCNFFMWVDEDANPFSGSGICDDVGAKEIKRKNFELDELMRKNSKLMKKVELGKGREEREFIPGFIPCNLGSNSWPLFDVCNEMCLPC
ncbi:Zinc finger, GRF-type [Sesbania bispinosa]|nr:Zinc finger, GRF-type [Sesbania bispinosa]